MNKASKALIGFERITVTALQFLTVVMIAISTVVLFFLGFETIRTNVLHIDSVALLLMHVQRSIAGILIVVMGLEILETLKIYLREHYIRLEVILIVAVIAVSRKIIEMDLEHASAELLVGLSALIVSLTVGYFLIRRSHYGSHPRVPESSGGDRP